MWTEEIIEGRPPRCRAMTGLRGDQVADLVTEVFGLLGGCGSRSAGGSGRWACTGRWY
jgi:hypothetical protein